MLQASFFDLQSRFEVMYRLLIYSQKLRNTSAEVPIEEWIDLEISKRILEGDVC